MESNSHMKNSHQPISTKCASERKWARARILTNADDLLLCTFICAFSQLFYASRHRRKRLRFQNDGITSCGFVEGGIVTRSFFSFVPILFFNNERTLRMTKGQGKSIIHRVWKNLMSKKEAKKTAEQQKKWPKNEYTSFFTQNRIDYHYHSKQKWIHIASPVIFSLKTIEPNDFKIHKISSAFWPSNKKKKTNNIRCHANIARKRIHTQIDWDEFIIIKIIRNRFS